jgi:hypothetical protein
VRVTNTKSSKYFILLASQTHKKKTERVLHWPLLLFRVLEQEISFGQKGYPKKKVLAKWEKMC